MFSSILAFVASHILYFALHLETSNFPKPLKAEEERLAFIALKNGDKAAADKLISHNLRLVAHVVKKYYNNANPMEDLISIGTIGMIKAVNTFDYEKGARFSTYAARCIDNEILMQFRNDKKECSTISIYDTIEHDKDGNSLTLYDIVADDFDLELTYDGKQEIKKVYSLLSKLEERERKIIILRYGLYGKKPLTQQQVANILNISRSFISRIEGKAINKLKKYMSSK